ncbi:Phthiocerol synthesis polyketide synthase type I PpsC [Pseudovibrio axinellae]|uniref:Phthiocerol synthesis polyketide synthase type I PpsC n=1 Tax=Pseudovibrio axinellae TaxID=989403 RepID=A0A166AAY9_9HYPH|nr:NAD(P)H-quinone oxidoreductase [Pseudovibrio axinellae]KZL20809.1 Phthiocerol synthesis polyketide synthase type I PpsC [Pseudovibrio axinellae]SER21883.1 putative NAD(P)H quinone oxidoreductase, PIG3 family [Pseudovibrio axinellae]
MTVDDRPELMKAVVMNGVGGSEVLEIAQIDVPKPGVGEVLIKVHAAGINRPDVFQRKGAYPPPEGASPLLGLEVAGEIAELGEGVSSHVVGERVCALTPGGGYAEYCIAPAAHVLPVPAGVSMEEAAGIPEAFFTVWSNVFDRLGLRGGERFLVHGGSSGIGTTAIQLAKAFGAEVFATVGSDVKAQAVRELGTDYAINYRETDFVKEIQNITEKRGVDVILDMVGGDYVEKNWIVAAVEGRICQIATLHGVSENVNFSRLMMKRLTHTGSTLRPRSNAYKAQIASSLREKVWPLLETGKVKVVLDKVFDIADVRAAHERMESSGHIGKIVLKLA